MKITVNVPQASTCEATADYLRHVADQIEDGFTSGHVDRAVHWDSAPDPDGQRR